ncbi:MAG: hypothetical protein D084_Lepto4C00245G0003 [Leptospirillum sp. Group IV 'UBA BS']|nr:MAG: hypothetical protein D084_Lepto4C00245G0003 [Leptospirillum sp. Group IV 'UBA BS']
MIRWDSFRRPLEKNLPLKVLALVLSLALWFHISRTGREYFSLTVPVTVVKLPPHLELARTLPDRVTLTLEGPPGFGRQIHAESLSVILDGHSFSPGVRTLRIDSSTLTLPTGVSVVRFTPEKISLDLLPLSRKSVRILPLFIGETQHRITPLRVRITPDHALIEGDRNELASIHFLKTRAIELSRLTGIKTQSFSVSIAIPDSTRIRLLSSPKVVVEITHSASINPSKKR